jgi:transposase
LDTRPTFGVFYMARYDEQFKLKAVQQYLSGDASYRQVAAAYGIEFSQLRCWVASFKAHGRCGLASKSGSYDAQLKLEVLDRGRSEGLSDRQLATLYDIRSTGHIGKWRSQYDAGGVSALEPQRRGRRPMPAPKDPPDPPHEPDEKRPHKELLEELAYLRAENAYLKKVKALIEAERTEALKKRRKSSKD